MREKTELDQIRWHVKNLSPADCTAKAFSTSIQELIGYYQKHDGFSYLLEQHSNVKRDVTLYDRISIPLILGVISGGVVGVIDFLDLLPAVHLFLLVALVAVISVIATKLSLRLAGFYKENPSTILYQFELKIIEQRLQQKYGFDINGTLPSKPEDYFFQKIPKK